MISVRLCFFLVFIIRSFRLMNALECYQCSEQMDKSLHCEVNVRTVLHETCTEGFVCHKYVKNYDGYRMVERHCAPKSKCQNMKRIDRDKQLESCESCDTDLCNSAPTLHLKFATINTMFIFFLSKLLK